MGAVTAVDALLASLRRLVRHPLRFAAEQTYAAWNSDLHRRIVAAVHHPIRSMRTLCETLKSP